MTSSQLEVVQRLAQATSAHDLDGIVACFAPDYRNDTPAHPSRSFRGQEQVRRNWGQILAGVPDISAEVVASAIDDDTVWSEWHMVGTRRDGARHEMRGVIIFEVQGAAIAAARFYLEPVEADAGTVDDAVRSAVMPMPGSGAT